jgi:hypothetical protein
MAEAAGRGDAGAVDAGRRDAGAVDAGRRDAAAVDAGRRDAAAVDAGLRDAGPLGCPARDASHGLGGSVAIAGDPGADPLGFGDPSLLFPAATGVGFMTYTAVDVGAAHTRLATSTDRGATWSYVGEVNAIAPLTITTTDLGVCAATTCTGSWVHEVSSLVDDPDDPDPARRYKVFAHSYFVTGAGVLRYEIGSIDLWTTAALAPGATWDETRLLGWKSSSSQSSTGVSAVVTTDPTLSPLLGPCVAMTEPGALVHDGTIDLALGCEQAPSASDVFIDIRLVRSFDHAQTWVPVATLLDQADAVTLGASGGAGVQINAADLFVSGGTTYLLATPNGAVTTVGATPNGYRGCVTIPFASLDAGTLARCNGAPAVTMRLEGATGLFNGACTWAPGATAAGVMGLSADVSRTPAFQLFASGVSVP